MPVFFRTAAQLRSALEKSASALHLPAAPFLANGAPYVDTAHAL
jgi:hypothetical protein